MGRYTNKVGVVTGGSTGIGFATARRFAAEGGRVIITGRSAKSLERAAIEIGPQAVPLVADTSKLGDIDRLVGKVKELGGIDFLFVNAGIPRMSPLETEDEASYDEVLNVNTKGAYFTVQKLAPHIHEGGSVVFNTSVVNVKGFPGMSAYSASKAALRSLARTFATELLPRKIRVNAVSPGPIETPIFEKMGIPEEAKADTARQFTEVVPMKRFGRAEEVARAALYLGFDATFTTGAELPVDGGLSQL
ncbi:MAG TPA: SDR family oxidoreductase [Polyangia bacterium]|nr:SDR family oxidoreductase [Polyangia bacterium]